ncbi:MAG: hypothetical protein WEA99_07625 [Brumimicrobium sp.]
MFYFFFKKEFLGPSILMVLFGLFLFFIDSTSEHLISSILGEYFEYAQNPFLKLIYLLLLVVTIGFLSALNKNENIDADQKRSSVYSFLFYTILSMAIGLGIHVYAVVDTILSSKSMMDLENNIFFYYCTDFFLMFGFILGAFKFLRPSIHQK